MSRPITPTPTSSPNDPAPPRTPGADLTPNRGLPPRIPGAHADGTPTMRVQRQTPMPSTPGGHRRTSSIPHTPGGSALTCSSSPSSFTKIIVHTAKCSECDKRNLETMLRCPGCTFQVCKPCRDRREAAERSLAHGNMMTPRVATPGTGGSVVRRKPVSTVESGEKMDKGKEARQEKVKGVSREKGALKEKLDGGEMKGRKRMVKPAPKPKPKAKAKARETTPSDDSTDDEFAPDPASPTTHKRRRTELTSKIDGISDVPSPFLQASHVQDSKVPGKALGEMTTDELLAHHGVNTPKSPYKAHLLSRHEPVVSDPVIEIPEIVKRGFKPRPSAEEIQQNIQHKVREKMGLLKPTEGDDGDK